jgi:DNA-binding NarL/FixJ family response regulator
MPPRHPARFGARSASRLRGGSAVGVGRAATIRAMSPDLPIGVVADGTPMLRAGIAATLRGGGFDIVGEAAQGAEVVGLVESHQAAIVVIGSLMDLPTGELVRSLASRAEPPTIVVMIGRATPDAIAELLSLSVDALVPRSIAAADLVQTAQRALHGERVIDPGVLVVDITEDDEPAEANALTAREREVLVLLSNGHSNREIASSLYVSLPTVKTHLAHIYAKLGAKNRNEALGRAVANGLL